MPVLFGGHNLLPLVEIGLTDRPKTGGDTQAFFQNLSSEIQIGNQQVWGNNWGLKVVIHKFSMENLEKKDLNFKFKV